MEKLWVKALVHRCKSIFNGDKRRAKLTEFTLFMQLPAEIRIQIWRYRSHRVIRLIAASDCYGIGYWRALDPPPAAFGVCHESRQEARRIYQRLWLAESVDYGRRKDYAYIDFGCDAIIIDGSSNIDALITLVLNEEQLHKNLLYLAISHRLWASLISNNRLDMIHRLGALKELVILHDEKLDGSRHRRQKVIRWKERSPCVGCAVSDQEMLRLAQKKWKLPSIKSFGNPKRISSKAALASVFQGQGGSNRGKGRGMVL